LLLAGPVFGQEPRWEPPADWPPTLRDIASRLPRDTPAREPDLITYAHEGSHFLSKGRPGYHGIYIGNGRRWEIPTPPLLTEQVFANVPEHRRGTIYRTYARQGQDEYWRKQPLMVCDEWRAYTVGSRTRREMRAISRRETDIHCATMAFYSKSLYDLASRIPDYDMSELRGFCQWNNEQCRDAIPEWDALCGVKFD
jgi:hypothetical protein